MAGRSEPIAVVLFQLGGPDSLDAVEPFLFNLFSDPDIIDFPFARLARPTLARLISSWRARHVQQHYALIGGKSPLRELTERQAAALERELRKTVDARVFVAMRYWHPLTEEVVEPIADGNFRELVLLPLYPQYSKTTTGSSLNEWNRQYNARVHQPLPTRLVREFFDHLGYLDAVAERINEGLARFRPLDVILSASEESQHSELKETLRGVHPGRNAGVLPLRAAQGQDDTRRAQGDKGRRSLPSSGQAPNSATEDVWLVFSAHGVPVRVTESGDPYQQQIEETVRRVMARGGWPNPHVLCWQSRVNPGKWLEPSLGETLRAFAAQGARRALIIPISFVSDHLETLAEIDIEARALANQAGIRQFELMPALNDSPTFLRALADLVLAQVGTRASAFR